MTPEQAMLFAIGVPWLGALLIVLAGRMPNLRETMTFLTAVTLLLVVVPVTGPVLDGARWETPLWEVLPGVGLQFALEPLGMIFALVASGLWIVNSLYSLGYMRGNNEQHQTVFYACFAVAIGAAMGVAFAANLFTLFLFYEILTLSTYPLVTHKRNPDAVKAGRTYLGILLFTSVVFLLSAIIATMALSGSVTFTPGGVLEGHVSSAVAGFLLALYAFGIGKAALMPVHKWLPAAMVAPTPVSALLHAVAVVKAGVFSLLKVVVYIFGLDFLDSITGDDWLVYVAGVSVLLASLVAVRQDNLKRRLAYSTISQLSYVVMATAMAHPLAAVGAAMHIVAHAFGKITLFFAAGSIYTAAHKSAVSQLDGIGRRMPWTMVAFGIGALSMIGVPLTGGFFGKWFMMEAGFASGQWFVLLVLFGSTMLNAAYLLPIVYVAFMRPETVPPEHEHGEAPLPMVIALSITAALSVLVFLVPDVPLALARAMAGLGG